MKPFQQYYKICESLNFCTENDMRIHDLYRMGTPTYFHFIRGVREMSLNEGINHLPIHPWDRWILEQTDVGEFSAYEEKMVALDMPMTMTEEEDDDDEKELDVPKRGGPKKFYVYTKNKDGNVVKVTFGDPDMSVNFDDGEARKSFAARHKCSEKTDKTTPGWWSCNLPKFADNLGLSGGGNFFW